MSEKKFRPSSEKKRQAIIEAAAQAFFAHGYEGSSIEGIAEDAGVSKVTVYNYFGGKPGLLSAAVEHEIEQMHQYLCLDGMAAGDLKDILLALGHAFNDFLSRPEIINFDRRMAAESVRHPEIGQTFLEAGPRRMHGQLTQLMAMAHEKGEIRVEDPAIAAEQFASMCKGFGDLERRFSVAHDSDAAKERVHAAVETFFRAYGTA